MTLIVAITIRQPQMMSATDVLVCSVGFICKARVGYWFRGLCVSHGWELLIFGSNLVSAYEKAKKKHQNKLKKLESQMMAMVERHETQVRMLKQRIALLEEENSRPHTNETSL